MTLDGAMQTLLAVDEGECPLLSCFVDLSRPRSVWQNELHSQSKVHARTLPTMKREAYEEAFSLIDRYLETSLRPESRSAALFVRGGKEPLMVSLQFEVPMETRLIVDGLPQVYPLVELRDTYDRFVIVITTEKEARILETTMGAVSRQILSERPELRQRIGREWTRERYQNHREDRDNRFIKEKVRILDDLVKKRGHNHLVVTGSPKMVSRFVGALPPHLEEKLIHKGPTNPKAGLDVILLEAIQSFAEAENAESHDHVARLESSILSSGLGVSGYEASKTALESGCGDLLVVDQDYPDTEQREELIRLAAQSAAHVETVQGSEVLARLSGVGCLLRYRPDHW